MLLHKSGRFHIGNISFGLPNDMYVNLVCGVERELGFQMEMPGEQFKIVIQCEYIEGDVGNYWYGLCYDENSFELVDDYLDIQINGVIGNRLKFNCWHSVYTEYAFPILDCDEANTLSIALVEEIADGYDSMKAHAIMDELLATIKPNQTI